VRGALTMAGFHPPGASAARPIATSRRRSPMPRVEIFLFYDV
jgi:hypothetical protein